ncbi:MAG: MotA/TolQ/ExbB proton channel family protein [Candidatus Brocadiia bacterium]
MYPILACSVVAVGIIAERVIRLRGALSGSDGFLRSFSDITTSGFDPGAALNLCDKTPGLLPRLARVAVIHRDRPREQIKESLEVEAARMVPELQRHLNLLGVIAQVAPLLGLLGTVIGLINSFAAIQAAAQTGQGVIGADVVAGGIWVALLTTAAGLTVAIPVYVAHSFLERWSDTIITELEVGTGEIVRLMEGGEI